MRSADSPVFDRLDRAFFAFGWLVVIAGLLISPRPDSNLFPRPHIRASFTAPKRPAPTTLALWPGTETEQHTVRPASDPHRAVDVTSRERPALQCCPRTETVQPETEGPLGVPASPGSGARAVGSTEVPRSLPNRPAAIDSRAPGERGADGATAERSSGFVVGRNHRAPFSLLQAVLVASKARRVPFHTLAGLAEDESSWRPTAVGAHGEVGLFQLKRAVARWCGIKDRRNPSQNADCAARYLAAQFDRFGTWEMAIVAFKAGPAAIPDNIPASSWAFAQRALVKAEAYR